MALHGIDRARNRRENRFGHPAPKVLAMLQGLSVWRTDRHGTVAVLADRDGLRIVPRR